MKKIFALTVLLSILNYISAQITWKPQWQKGKVETVEYNYCKQMFESEKFKSRDSVHAVINIRYISENESFYFLEWTFVNYFNDTTGAEKKSDGMVYDVIRHMAAAAPIKVRLEKGDFDIKILNRAYLDSVQAEAIKQVTAALPAKKDSSSYDMSSMLGLLVTLGMEEKFYGLIYDYYSIYSTKNLKLNVKQDLAEKKEDSKDAITNLFGSLEGFSIFEDTDPVYYRQRYEAKFDFSKMVAGLSKMTDDKKGKTKKKARPDKTIGDASKSGGGLKKEIRVTKADMLMSYSYYLMDMDLSMMGSESREIEMKSFKKTN